MITLNCFFRDAANSDHCVFKLLATVKIIIIIFFNGTKFVAWILSDYSDCDP